MFYVFESLMILTCQTHLLKSSFISHLISYVFYGRRKSYMSQTKICTVQLLKIKFIFITTYWTKYLIVLLGFRSSYSTNNHQSFIGLFQPKYTKSLLSDKLALTITRFDAHLDEKATPACLAYFTGRMGSIATLSCLELGGFH